MKFLGIIAIIALTVVSIFIGAISIVAIADWLERRKRHDKGG